jgi:hypothetical protein
VIVLALGLSIDEWFGWRRTYAKKQSRFVLPWSELPPPKLCVSDGTKRIKMPSRKKFRKTMKLIPDPIMWFQPSNSPSSRPDVSNFH